MSNSVLGLPVYFLCISLFIFPGGSEGKEPACKVEDLGLIPGSEDPLEKEMATHSSTLAWKIPWTEKPGAGYSPWGYKESDKTEQLSLSLFISLP